MQETAVQETAVQKTAVQETAVRDTPTPDVAAPEITSAPAAERAAAPPPSLGHAIATLGIHLRGHRRVIAFAGALLVLAGGTGLIEPLVVRQLLADGGLGRAGTLVVQLVLLVLAGALMSAVGGFLLSKAAEGVVLSGRVRLAGRLLRLPMAAMRRHEAGDLLSRITSDTTLLRQVVTQTVVQGLTAVVTVIGTVIMMLIVDPLLLLITLGVVTLLGTVVGVAMPLIRKAALAAQQSVGAMGTALERALGAFTTVKACGAEVFETEQVTTAASDAYRHGVRLARWASVTGTVAALAVQTAFLSVLAIGGARVASGAITVATLVAFLLYVLYLAQPVVSLVSVGTYFQAARAAVQRITEITELPTEAVDAPGDAPAVDCPTGSGSAAHVAIRDVAFCYPGRTTPALDGLTLDIPATGVTALVGPSGAGKTTVLSLIERFDDPDRGGILLDGRDLRTWPLAHLRGSIGYVEQDAPVLSGTLRENLAYARPEATDAELHTIVRITRLTELLDRLGGLDAELGARGSALSGGERQRIAIGRALLRRPRLLLMDEATSQLDAVNEAALREVIRDIAATTTVLVVAHRLSTVRDARQIALIEEGRLRATGTHAELLRDSPLYARLAANQLIGTALEGS